MSGAQDGVPAAWRAVALSPAQAHGGPPAQGVLRATAADFMVEELLGFEPDAGVAHRLLRVEKTDANTLYVARALARHAGVRPADVGFAGLKDRHAVALQWFTVPARPGVDWAGCAGEGFRVLEAHAHSRKLKRGALAGNRFRITVRELQGDSDSLAARLQTVREAGVPGYFGAQRFGRDGANLERVHDWMSGAPLPRDREERGFVLSSARSLLFNAVLDARVRAGSWSRLMDGEVVNLAGSASVFQAEVIDDILAGRCSACDVHPTGPLPGRGGKLPAGAAFALEQSVLEPFQPLVERLAAAGVDGSRRALRVPVADLLWNLDGAVLELSFRLPRGAFATSVLRELVDTGTAAIAEPETD